MNPVIVLCSRPESRRLPGKVFKRICGMPALDILMNRVSHIPWKRILAVDREENAPLYQPYASHHGWDIHVGQPDSPLHRTIAAVRHFSPESQHVCRITHDDILIDPRTAIELAAQVKQEGAGYGFSPGIIEGAGVEIIHTKNLSEASYRQGPTEFVSYFVQGPSMPVPGVTRFVPRQAIRRSYRLTMDYPGDALVLEAVLRQTGKLASVDDICAYLDCHSHILNFNHLPDVTVYTCVHNMAHWVAESMRTVRDSTVDLEYILIDDASSDGTLSSIAKGFPDRRLKVLVNDGNLGLASSSNRALGEARGRWVLRLDADDLLLPGAIKRMMDAGEREGAHLVYAAYREIAEDGTPLDIKDPREKHHAGCALMARRYINELRFKDGLRLGDSAELFKRASEKGARISYIDEPLWLYRQTQGSLTRHG